MPVDNFEYTLFPENIEPQPSLTYGLGENRISGFVDGKKAVEQAVRKILSTERYASPVYSWNYGTEAADFIGQDSGYIAMESARIIREALLQDDRILDVSDFSCSYKKNIMAVTFTVKTIFGDFVTEKEVGNEGLL